MIELLSKIHPNKLYPVLFEILIKNRGTNNPKLLGWLKQAINELNKLLPHYLKDLRLDLVMK